MAQYTGVVLNPSPAKYSGRFVVTPDDKTTKMFYWVILVGDYTTTSDGLYPWAVVSDPFGLDLFILARNMADFALLYEEEVLRQVTERGFTYALNMPIRTFQSGTDCDYPPAL